LSIEEVREKREEKYKVIGEVRVTREREVSERRAEK
jgi:hypothetical protein